MKGKHFREDINRISKKSKSIILSIIAVIELILLMTSMTFSWFEGLTSLEMKGEGIQTAAGLNSHIEIGENNDANDTTYDGIIDLTKFYDTQKQVRLSPVSSADAENFYAAYKGEPGAEGTKYRKLSQEDINANIIQFEFTISSPDGPTDIFLSAIYPRVRVNGTKKNGSNVTPYRIAFSDDEVTRIVGASATSRDYASLKTISSLTSTDTAVTTTGVIENYQNYYYSGSHVNPVGPLFQLNKGETKTITCSIWIDPFDPDYAKLINKGDNISFGIRLCTSWSISREITVYDYTADQWIDTKDTDNGHNDDMKLFVRNLDGGDNRRLYELKYDATNHKWTGTIPIALKNCEFVWKTDDDDSETRATWKAYNRGTSTEITMLGSDDYIWGIGSDDVVKIALSDYTKGDWLNDNGNDKLPPEMRVQINYNGTALDYSMTDGPTGDKNGKDTWYAYIPKVIDTVRFNRCDRSNNSKVYNYWIGTDRGNETVYRAIDDGEIIVDASKTIYLEIADGINFFFHNSRQPAVSLTSDNNISVINGLGSNLAALGKGDYKTNDTWPASNGVMTQISSNLFAYTFDELQNGEYFTFWDCDSSNFNDLDSDTHFAPAVQYNASAGNKFTINNAIQLTGDQFSNAYIFTGTWSQYGNNGDTSTEPDDNQKTGEWGEAATLPTGTAVNFKHYDSSVSSVTATFTYSGDTYTLNLTKGNDNLTWSTSNIPNSVTSIEFKDGTNSWSTSSRSTSTTNNYYYAVSKNTGKWGASNLIRIYFTSNYGWSDHYVHYWGGSSETSWPGLKLDNIATNNQNQKVYVGLIPSNTPNIIFNGNDSGGTRRQTVTISSDITDMKGFYISGGSGNDHTAATWDVTADWLKSYSN